MNDVVVLERPTELLPLHAQVIRDPVLQSELAKEEDYALLAFEARERWLRSARSNQLPPTDEENWDIAFWCCGRGFGKTRTGAEDLWWYGWEHPKTLLGVIGPTFSDCRDVCFEGESGLLSCIPEKLVVEYNRTLLELQLRNGTHIKGFTAEKPNKLRGPQHHRVWADELGSWQYPAEALAQIDFGLRLGQNPRLLITTTPIPSDAIQDLMKTAKANSNEVRLFSGSTFENEKNLAPRFLRKMLDKYEGTRLGRQELHAEILSDTPGALWTYKLLEECRVQKLPDLVQIVIGLDPPVTSSAESDEAGIVVAAKGVDGHGYILADMSVGQATPTQWATAAINAFAGYCANFIVAEVNNGGELVTDLITRLGKGLIPVRGVHASVGKFARAEPISMLYEQKKIHHLGIHGKLESQMCTYVPGVSKKSPDRMDALVWAVAQLFPIVSDEYLGRIRIL